MSYVLDHGGSLIVVVVAVAVVVLEECVESTTINLLFGSGTYLRAQYNRPRAWILDVFVSATQSTSCCGFGFA